MKKQKKKRKKREKGMERECRWEKYLSNNYTYPEEFEIVEWAYRSAGFPRVSINPRTVVAFNYRDRFRFVGRLLFEPRRWPRNSCNQVRRLNLELSPFFFFYFPSFSILLIFLFNILKYILKLIVENFRKDII